MNRRHQIAFLATTTALVIALLNHAIPFGTHAPAHHLAAKNRQLAAGRRPESLSGLESVQRGSLRAEFDASAPRPLLVGTPLTGTLPPPSYAGLNEVCGSATVDLCEAPSDGALAVGPSQILEAVNNAFAFYDRSQHHQMGPSLNFSALFGISSTAGTILTDPQAFYDAGNANGGYGNGHGRFVMLDTARNNTARTASYLLAVSADEAAQAAASSWCAYTLNAGATSGRTKLWADYPAMGMDGDNIYITSNEYTFTSTVTQAPRFKYARIMVLPKVSLYPDALTHQCPTPSVTAVFTNTLNPDGTHAFTLQPATQPDALPHQTSPVPMYFVDSISGIGMESGNGVDDEDGGDAAASTGPSSTIAVRSITVSPTGPVLSSAHWATVSPYSAPQPAQQPSGPPLATGDNRLRNAVYRYGTIYTAHTTGYVSSGLSGGAQNKLASVQWYAIDPTSLGAQSYAVSDENVSYFDPGITVGCVVSPTIVTGGGLNCALPMVGLEASGSSVPLDGLTTRPSQPASAFAFVGNGQPLMYQLGAANYQDGSTGTAAPNRWGDYPGVSTDPTNASAVWVLGEYALDSTHWGTAFSALTPSTAEAWGSNFAGQLGNGGTTNSPVPAAVGGALPAVTEIGGGVAHSVALGADGSVWAWGDNSDGQLGNGNGGTSSITPTQVVGITNAVGLAVGEQHTVARKADGTVWAWGADFAGQLGNGRSSGSSDIPVRVIGLNKIIAVGGSGSHSLAIENNNGLTTVWAWGDNQYSQCGYPSQLNQPNPVQVQTDFSGTVLEGVDAVSGGSDHSVALKTDGTVWTWGGNYDGQLGNGSFDTLPHPFPAQVPGLDHVVAIAAGSYHTLALKSDGTVWAWGNNLYGELGNGTTAANPTAAQVVGFTHSIVAIAAGDAFSMALDSSGEVWAWGSNLYGELGNGSIGGNITTPTLVSGIPPQQVGNAVAIAAGQDHALILTRAPIS